MRRSYLNAGSNVKHIFEPREVFFDSCIDEYFVLIYIQGVFEVEAFLVTRGAIHYS
jgi:hypothetical protein